MTMIRSIGVLGLGLVIACVAEAPELEERGQPIEVCPGCGANGLKKHDWDYVFSNLDRNALNRTNPANDLWDDATNSPASLCDPATLDGAGCTMRAAWSAWIDSGTRVGIYTNLAKVVLPRGTWVRDPGNGIKYHGAFGLMAWARGGPWRAEGRELASAGLEILLNAVEGVAICLNTRQLPDNCAGSTARFSESITFGDAIHGGAPRFIAIAGGQHAPDPRQNLRYGSIPTGASSAFDYATSHCTTARDGQLRYPVACTDGGGGTWHNAVHALTWNEPNTWYYGPPPPGGRHPEQWPQVPY